MSVSQEEALPEGKGMLRVHLAGEETQRTWSSVYIPMAVLGQRDFEDDFSCCDPGISFGTSEESHGCAQQESSALRGEHSRAGMDVSSAIASTASCKEGSLTAELTPGWVELISVFRAERFKSQVSKSVDLKDQSSKRFVLFSGFY